MFANRAVRVKNIMAMSPFAETGINGRGSATLSMDQDTYGCAANA